MSTMFDCQGSSCFESLLETLIAGAGSVAFVQGFKRITKDRNNLLNQVNKIIYGIGMAQMILLFLYFFFWGSDLVISTVRCLRLVSEAMLCYVLSEIVFEEEYYHWIQKALKVCLVFVFVEWFWTAIINQSVYDYFCLQMDYLFLSSSTFILTLFAAYLGTTALQLLRSFQEENQTPEKQNTGENYDEMSNRSNQIKLLLGSDCLAALVQFIWDYVAYTNSLTLNDCKDFYEAESLFGVLGFTFLKFITLILPSLTIYYVFYYKQKNQFNTSTAQQLDADVFFDDRSNMIRNSSVQELLNY